MAVIGSLQLWCLVIVTVVGISNAGRGYDVCSLPKETGPCRGAFSRYYFNAKTERCEEFTYGGCKGNKNNFKTFEDCWTSCGDQDVCSLPSETGPCRAYDPSYYFNIKSGLCEKFVYGGCAGNANRFRTLDDCRTACGGCELCKLPKVVGPCEGLISRYYYNYKAQECQEFYYGGCQGNANNFERIEECRFQCIVRRF